MEEGPFPPFFSSTELYYPLVFANLMGKEKKGILWLFLLLFS